LLIVNFFQENLHNAQETDIQSLTHCNYNQTLNLRKVLVKVFKKNILSGFSSACTLHMQWYTA